MGHSARILAASRSPHGIGFYTFELVIPRIILAELNTHCIISRNSASSRAIPVEKMLRMVMEDPYIPTHWGKNQKGMQADVEVDEPTAKKAEKAWLYARDLAAVQAQELLELGIHKQITNRLLEPFMWHTVVASATELSNLFHLRNNSKAHPDFIVVANMMQEEHERAEPEDMPYGKWHCPLITPADVLEACSRSDPKVDAVAPSKQTLLLNEMVDELLKKVSVARCARVSYLTHEGKRDLQADLGLHDELLTNGHMSPFEHVARPMQMDDPAPCRADVRLGTRADISQRWSGKLRGWVPYRSIIPFESDILAPR